MFEPEEKLFNHISVIRFVDGKNAESLYSNLKTDAKEISLLLIMDTFKSAGSKAFSISKYLDIRLKQTSYTLSHKSTTWLTKSYSEGLTEEELKKISERLLHLALAEINKKLKQIVG